MVLMPILELLKALLYGIIEGITEWLPISSTGHLILLGEWLPLAVSPGFFEMFEVVIQLGAILAVVVLYFERLNPLAPGKTPKERRSTWGLWGRVLIAVLPSALLGLLLDDWLDAHFFNYSTVAITLILYGVAFILLERRPHPPRPMITDTAVIPRLKALGIGLFQALALIPGTSRSGATILGAMLLGLDRPAAAEFSFFMAIPTMAGAGLVKVVSFLSDNGSLTGAEGGILAVGCISAFLISLAAIRFLTDFVKRHSFAPFGVYRIALGLLVLASLAIPRP